MTVATNRPKAIGVGIAIGIGIERETGGPGQEYLGIINLLPDRAVLMMTKVGQRRCAVHGQPGDFEPPRIEPDSDVDPDPEDGTEFET